MRRPVLAAILFAAASEAAHAQSAPPGYAAPAIVISVVRNGARVDVVDTGRTLASTSHAPVPQHRQRHSTSIATTGHDASIETAAPASEASPAP